LACAAHLLADGVGVRLIGPRMAYWAGNMPAGMCLRSPWQASSISGPGDSLTLDAFEADQGVSLSRPIPLADFLRYAQWFGERIAPAADERRVRSLASDGAGFRLVLEDGTSELAERVIVATGLESYERVPEQLSDLPEDLALHSSRVNEPSQFEGQAVAVLGAGQSAVETAALLAEAGAQVELIGRRESLRWLTSSSWLHARRGPIRKLLYPPTDVGPPGLNQITSRPRLWKSLPEGLRERIAYRSIRPAASAWLSDRVGDVTVTMGRTIDSAAPLGEGLELRLDDGSTRAVDRLVMATGFKVDLARHRLMSPELMRSVRTVDGYPRLGRGYESSLPGLHFVGAMAARSYGPLMRFVSGTTYAAPTLARHLAGVSPVKGVSKRVAHGETIQPAGRGA
jgi:hypothetical protein